MALLHVPMSKPSTDCVVSVQVWPATEDPVSTLTPLQSMTGDGGGTIEEEGGSDSAELLQDIELLHLVSSTLPDVDPSKALPSLEQMVQELEEEEEEEQEEEEEEEEGRENTPHSHFFIPYSPYPLHFPPHLPSHTPRPSPPHTPPPG